LLLARLAANGTDAVSQYATQSGWAANSQADDRERTDSTPNEWGANQTPAVTLMV
jgi:hypothetical protein